MNGVPFVKSSKLERVGESLAVYNLTLSGDDLSQLDALVEERRGGPDPDKTDPSTRDTEISEACKVGSWSAPLAGSN